MSGGFKKKTIRDIEVRGKRVLLRADYNVPLVGGKVVEDYRLQASLPTIKYLLEHKADGIAIISHLGRPGGQRDSSMSLKPVGERLSQLLGKEVKFAGDCVGDEASKVAAELKAGQILLLENLRFHPGEEANDPAFATELARASGVQTFVQDGFGVIHRKHASTDAITKILPAVAGLLIEKEVKTIDAIMDKPERPLTVVVGGAKASDKIELIEKFIGMADCVALAGALANTFLAATGLEIGGSQVDKDKIAVAKDLIAKADTVARERAFRLVLPTDGVASQAMDGTRPTRVVDYASGLADIEAYPKKPNASSGEVMASEKILDIGPVSAARIAGAISMSRTVIWNGTLGITEVKGLAGAAAPFGHGTKTVAQAIIGDSRVHRSRPFSVAGGGDTSSYIEQNNLIEDFNFVSTGGGAFLEYLAGNKLPGLEALQDKP